ncbi:MAG: hypothetical protein EPN22_06875 [Nitrospirae bacterium]|nr:MAG: hypothetical protein EPN22_06875 [Nitrospirota bacterium]
MSEQSNHERMEHVRKYHEFLNVIIGLFAFGAALQCLSFSGEVTLPFDYKIGKAGIASLSVILCFLLILEPARAAKIDFDELRKQKHAYSDKIFLFFRGLPFIVGFVFLCLIALGKIK